MFRQHFHGTRRNRTLPGRVISDSHRRNRIDENDVRIGVTPPGLTHNAVKVPPDAFRRRVRVISRKFDKQKIRIVRKHILTDPIHAQSGP